MSRNIEVGFHCEKCNAPLEDRPPVNEDWRTPLGETRRLCGKCLDNEAIDKAIGNISEAGTAYLKHFTWALDQINKCFANAAREIKVAHVVGPLGAPKCPKCGGEGEKMGSWDRGPFWWQCEDCGEQWGHA